MFYRNFLKNGLELIIALLMFLLLFPVFVFIWFLLLIQNKGKAFFLQPRPGLRGKIFKIIKFRTMSEAKSNDGKLLSDEERLTFLGRVIRKSSLDEIPQLLNVIKGDMSIIGPRPLLVEYLPLYNDCQKRRHEVKPGITGWAQVNGRNAISWEQKFEYDVWYVDHLCFTLDVKIIFLTITKIIKAQDVNEQGKATVEYFKGNV